MAEISSKKNLPIIDLGLAAPALRALKAIGVTDLKSLAKYSEEYISSLHGVGKKALGIMKKYLKRHGYSFQ
jgi:DNA-directed RNA polymerase alpha subunit